MRAVVRQYARQWVAALRRAEPKAWDEVSDRLLRRMRSRGHSHLLADVENAVRNMVSDNPVVPVQLITARPVDNEAQKALVARVLGDKPASISASVNKALLGGAILRTPNEQWDFSVKGQIDRLSRSLADA